MRVFQSLLVPPTAFEAAGLAPALRLITVGAPVVMAALRLAPGPGSRPGAAAALARAGAPAGAGGVLGRPRGPG